MKQWEIQNNFQFSIFNFQLDRFIKILLANRGLKTKKETGEFLNPSLESLTIQNLGIDKKQLEKSLKRIKKAIEKKEQIIIFGDYDADGVCGTAILWETLNSFSANVMPYIPHRIEEGYGLSIKGIDNLLIKYPETKLIITVDNGIVAIKAVDYANSLGIDVIVTDHHVPGKTLPKAYSIVHSVLICGASVAYVLAREIRRTFSSSPSVSSNVKRQTIRASKTLDLDEHIGLAAIATVTDVMRLTGFNRTILKFGLGEIRKSKRPGILAIVKSAAIDQGKIGVYELGHVIGPRLNATGRLEHAMDSLRLLCTKYPKRADELAKKLHDTNLERQELTLESFLHAKGLIGEKLEKKLLFVSDKSYPPGVIGLVAGKLVEEYYLPSIVLSVGETYSKASARSISGFNIIEFIRLSSDLLVDAGGHPMAAGFTIETKNIAKLQKAFEKLAKEQLADGLLVRKLKIDCELDIGMISEELFAEIQKLSPFGPGNPEPTFLAKGIIIENMQIVGANKNHLKVQLSSQTRSDLNRASNKGRTFNSIGGILFGYDTSLNLKIGDKADIVYTISQNEWNGNRKIELRIKDIKI